MFLFALHSDRLYLHNLGHSWDSNDKGKDNGTIESAHSLKSMSSLSRFHLLQLDYYIHSVIFSDEEVTVKVHGVTNKRVYHLERINVLKEEERKKKHPWRTLYQDAESHVAPQPQSQFNCQN